MTWDGPNLWILYGSGSMSTTRRSTTYSEELVAPSTGLGKPLPWTRTFLLLSQRPSLGYMTKASSIEQIGLSIGVLSSTLLCQISKLTTKSGIWYHCSLQV